MQGPENEKSGIKIVTLLNILKEKLIQKHLKEQIRKIIYPDKGK